jgi:hypothetical protein
MWKGTNSLFEPPVPLRMASLPVDWIAATMADGAANIAYQGMVQCKTSDMQNGTNLFLRWSPVDL